MSYANLNPEDMTAEQMSHLAEEAPAKWAFVMGLAYKHASLGHTQCLVGVDEVGPHHKKLELRGFRLGPYDESTNMYVLSWPGKPKLEVFT